MNGEYKDMEMSELDDELYSGDYDKECWECGCLDQLDEEGFCTGCREYHRQMREEGKE